MFDPADNSDQAKLRKCDGWCGSKLYVESSLNCLSGDEWYCDSCMEAVERHAAQAELDALGNVAITPVLLCRQVRAGLLRIA